MWKKADLTTQFPRSLEHPRGFTEQPRDDSEFALWKAEIKRSMDVLISLHQKYQIEVAIVEDGKSLSSSATEISPEVLPWVFHFAQANAVAELLL